MACVCFGALPFAIFILEDWVGMVCIPGPIIWCNKFPLVWYTLYLWLIVLLVIYFSFDISILMILLLLSCRYSVIGFMMLELYFLIILLYMVNSSTFERFGAEWYLRYFSIVVGFIFVVLLDINVLCLIIMIVIVAKLPLFGMHIWLPKVHVEASLLGSIFLAAIILKARSLFFYISCSVLPFISLIIFATFTVIRYVDGKGIVAMSSVIHMSVSVLVLSVVWMSGYSHILVSAFLFLAVYSCYINDGSRLLWSGSVIVILTNLGFPLIRRFIVEVVLSHTVIILLFFVYYYFTVVFVLNFYIRNSANSTSWGYWYVCLVVVFIII